MAGLRGLGFFLRWKYVLKGRKANDMGWISTNKKPQTREGLRRIVVLQGGSVFLIQDGGFDLLGNLLEM